MKSVLHICYKDITPTGFHVSSYSSAAQNKMKEIYLNLLAVSSL